jgi:hypothetical protein
MADSWVVMKATIQFDFMKMKEWFREFGWQAVCRVLHLRVATTNPNHKRKVLLL